jgi:hypothetical protein
VEFAIDALLHITRMGNDDDEYAVGSDATTPLDEHAFDIAFVMCISRGGGEFPGFPQQIRRGPHHSESSDFLRKRQHSG